MPPASNATTQPPTTDKPAPPDWLAHLSRPARAAAVATLEAKDRRIAELEGRLQRPGPDSWD